VRRRRQRRDPLIVLNVHKPTIPSFVTQCQPQERGFEGLSFALFGKYGYFCGFVASKKGKVMVVKVDNPTKFVLSGVVQSKGIAARGLIKAITKVTLTCKQDVPELTGIAYQLSNDGGKTWYDVKIGEEITFPSKTNTLLWKAHMFTQNPAISPIIYEVKVSYNYVPIRKTLSKKSKRGAQKLKRRRFSSYRDIKITKRYLRWLNKLRRSYFR
jgi:hypothetical protein